jgi:hypothetical protein
MLPGSLGYKNEAQTDLWCFGVTLAAPNPSARRLKCSWHLGMMMRIIETTLFETQADFNLLEQ